MKWYSKYLSVYNQPYDKNKSLEIINQIKGKIGKIQSVSPLVTISVIAHNEDMHLLSCLWSLSDMKCKYSVEIIGVDNDSEDNTLQIFKDCNIPTYTEKQHSCGFARQCGLNHAKGKFHLNIDSDTIYPTKYVENMVDILSLDNVVAVSSLWSYIPDKSHSRLGLILYETLRDVYLFFQSIKRPELSVRGLVFGYNTKLARSIGIRTDIIRGEDGSLALELKKYGKIKFLRRKSARAVTGYGTVAKDGSLLNSFNRRVFKILADYKKLFTSQLDYKDDKSNLIEH